MAETLPRCREGGWVGARLSTSCRRATLRFGGAAPRFRPRPHHVAGAIAQAKHGTFAGTGGEVAASPLQSYLSGSPEVLMIFAHVVPRGTPHSLREAGFINPGRMDLIWKIGLGRNI